MDYLLKASAILFIFYLFYRVILQKETFFQSNRIYLLIGIIASLTLPLIVIPIYVEQTVLPFQNFPITQSPDFVEIPNTINWTQILSIGYLSGVLFFGMKFLISLTSLIKVLIINKKEKEDGFFFIKSDRNESPFSFFNYIVYNPNSFDKQELQQILIHEKAHAYQWHSFDVLFSQLSTIIFWFNPVSWMYKKALQQNLEFIADAISQEKSSCQKSYQHLLLKTSITPNQFVLTNNFYNSLIKKRIIMLHKNKSKSTNQWKFAIIFPILTAFIFTFNTKTIAQTVVKTITTTDNNKSLILEEINEDTQITIITKDSNQTDLDNIKESFSNEDVLVKFKGVQRNSSNEITAIKIDVKSKQSSANFNTSSDAPIKPIKISFDKVDGNISIGNGGMHHGDGDIFFVSKDDNHKIHTNENENLSFVFVSDDGKYDQHQVIEIKGDGDNIFVIKKDGDNHLFKSDDGDEHDIFFISEDGDKKKVIITKNSNYTWTDTDGNTTVDIISSGDSDKTIWATSGSNKTVEVMEVKGDGDGKKMLFISDEDDSSPLFYIDGKESSKEALDKLDPDTIDKMEVLKGDKAIEKYGDKAKGGVILITTKK